MGIPAAARLRFDDAAPGRVDPQPVPGWVSRNVLPFALHLGRPAGPEPLSGIRGYAVSIDPTPSGRPCAGQYECSEAETDLRGGVDEDALSIDELPEGTSYVHAVAVSGSGMHSAEVGSTVLRVDKTDPETTLLGVPDGWSNRPLTLTARATDGASGMLADGSGGPFTAIRIDGGSPIAAPGDSVTATAIESGIHSIAYYARDSSGERRRRSVDQRPAEPLTGDGGGSHRPRGPAARLRELPGPRRPRADRGARRGLALGGRPRARADLGPATRIGRALRGSPDRDRCRRLARPLGLEAHIHPASTSSAPPPTTEPAIRPQPEAVATERRCASPRRSRSRRRCSAASAARASTNNGPFRYGRSVLYSGQLLAGRHAPLAGTLVRVVERFASPVTAAGAGHDGADQGRRRLQGPSRSGTESRGRWRWRRRRRLCGAREAARCGWRSAQGCD